MEQTIHDVKNDLMTSTSGPVEASGPVEGSTIELRIELRIASMRFFGWEPLLAPLEEEGSTWTCEGSTSLNIHSNAPSFLKGTKPDGCLV